MAITRFLLLILLVSFPTGQAIADSPTLPPLQWLNLTSLLNGSPPPPLVDAAIGYDEASRSIIVFGGQESFVSIQKTQAGLAQDQTFLLNLETLVWSKPNPPAGLQTIPPARSAAVAGPDFAASNRHGFVVIGGKDSNGDPLSDAWEFDFINQFWSNISIAPGGPSARWGAAGGIDTRVPSVQDPVLPGPNNTFYYAGGFGRSEADPLSDVWQFSIYGTLSSNLPNSTKGSWQPLKLNSLPPRINIASTVVLKQVVAFGGCTGNSPNNSCASPNTYVINTQNLQSQSPGPCPSARKSAVLTPNLISSDSTQAFLLLGTFNQSLWDDGGNLAHGEVDVIDVNAGLWNRVLPSGDPGTSSNSPTFPSPREGAAVVSFSQALVGQSRNTSSDTIVFGGRDASGNYLSEVWILRAYSGTVNPDGQLQTGPDASGSGVSNKIITQCATSLTPLSSSPSSSGDSNPNSPTTPSPPAAIVQTFQTSFLHKLFAPLSIALCLPAVLVYRTSLPPSTPSTPPSSVPTYLSWLLALVAYGLGVAGIATSFTSISMSTSPSTLSRRSSSGIILRTVHGKAGLALFVALYGMVPAATLIFLFYKRHHKSIKDETTTEESRNSAEKLGSMSPPSPSAPQSIHSPSRSGSPRPRAQSWGPSSLFKLSHEGRLSSDSESNLSTGPQRTFEILNRPPRRQPERLVIPTSATDPLQRVASRGLSEVDWLQRRRSLNAVGELDYAITQVSRNQPPSTPATTDVLVSHIGKPSSHPQLSPAPLILLRVIVHALLIGLCVLSLIALWSGAPRALFAVFLAWTIAFYTVIFILAVKGRPTDSLLALIIFRLRGQDEQQQPDISVPSSPRQDPYQQYPFPTVGPYVHHQPPFRPEPISVSSEGHREPDDNHEDEDEDEDTHQRRIEDEIERRDVSIVTVPKRKLWITNPS